MLALLIKRLLFFTAAIHVVIAYTQYLDKNYVNFNINQW